MIDLKKAYVEIFLAIKNDPKFLELLEINKDELDANQFLAQLREQVIEQQYPVDLLTNYNTRVCIYEDFSNRQQAIEVGTFRIDLLVTQDKNRIDRKILMAVRRLIEILDTKERRRQNLPMLHIGLDGLTCRSRGFNQRSSNTGWDKYTITFQYRFLV